MGQASQSVSRFPSSSRFDKIFPSSKSIRLTFILIFSKFQLPNASGATAQLMGNVTTKDGSQTQPLKVAVTSGTGVAQLSSGGQSSGSLLAQQQVVRKAKEKSTFCVRHEFNIVSIGSILTASTGSATSSANSAAAKNGNQTEKQTAQQLTLCSTLAT